ncbi:MAG: 30S ribosome-binding factor RbfA [Magnetococcales bacterium]|nr:30S ribosome-binding factor RbfA [Magnetococcales bacterium]MBF0322910.1 30S ribosome-binding factor RbfA [Magnetococcales bacterium]
MTLRTERVRVQIRREIATLLERGEVKDPRLTGVVSISDVEVSRDLSYATVYFSILGAGASAEAMEDAGAALNHAAGFIRSRLARRLKIRQIPILRFVKDNSFEYGSQIDRLLQSLHIPPVEEKDKT